MSLSQGGKENHYPWGERRMSLSQEKRRVSLSQEESVPIPRGGERVPIPRGEGIVQSRGRGEPIALQNTWMGRGPKFT